jgi:hypothetical protein
MESSDGSAPVSKEQPAIEPEDETTTKSATEPVDPTTQHSTPSGEINQDTGSDVFERRGSAASDGTSEGQADEGFILSRSVQDPSEELPIELVSLTDR